MSRLISQANIQRLTNQRRVLKRRESHTCHHLNKLPSLTIPLLFSSLSFLVQSRIILRQLPVPESICMFLQYSFTYVNFLFSFPVTQQSYLGPRTPRFRVYRPPTIRHAHAHTHTHTHTHGRNPLYV